MKKPINVLMLSALIATSPASADIAFNGFASIVAGATTSSDEQLWGFGDSDYFKPGSLFGLQVSSDLSEGLSVTAQIIGRGADDWDPKFEWAYLGYRVNDSLKVLVGRQRAPLYMYSDFLDVSYAYPWITPPRGVYDLPLDSIDGVSAVYDFELGEFSSTLHVVYGANTDEINAFGETIKPDFDDIFGAAFTANKDWLTLRAAYFTAESTLPLAATQPLVQGWQMTPFAEVANSITLTKKDTSFAELGFQLDFDSFFIVGEYTELQIKDSFYPKEKSSYIMAGYRFSDKVAHITFGQDESSVNRITGTVPYGLDPTLDYLKAQTDGLADSQANDTNYVTIGLRWDFHDSAALKFEYSDYQDDLDSNADAGLFKVGLVTVF
ncbi:porin [Thalassotalea profundi]|nr:porin [Thalassotalea profundi]